MRTNLLRSYEHSNCSRWKLHEALMAKDTMVNQKRSFWKLEAYLPSPCQLGKALSVLACMCLCTKPSCQNCCTYVQQKLWNYKWWPNLWKAVNTLNIVKKLSAGSCTNPIRSSVPAYTCRNNAFGTRYPYASKGGRSFLISAATNGWSLHLCSEISLSETKCICPCQVM